MSSEKTIRDPIYGYITIEREFSALVDTEEFQRLRNIRQTGYQALYPSALHNRFVHSLGVFHLGKKAFQYFEHNIEGTIGKCEAWDVIKNSFLAACLLHDVGHSPFSHTGEDYYSKGCDFTSEYAKLLHLPSDWEKVEPSSDSERTTFQFFSDLRMSKNNTGKPHEAMSSLLGLELCEKFSFHIDKDLFIRSIIGLKYSTNFTAANKDIVIKNAIISLLNGDLIDVDKLDYVFRDAYVTGYNSLTLDLDRLLAGYTIVKVDEYTFEVAYKKSSLSVIENVIYANDLERRWIQTHPTILYDCWLVNGLLGEFDDEMRKRYEEHHQKDKAEDLLIHPPTIYTKEALSASGFSDYPNFLRLLCDDDIISFSKNSDESFFAKQYFLRSARYKPLWKTEASFEHLTSGVFGNQLLDRIQKSLKQLVNFGSTSDGIQINDNLVKKLTEAQIKAQSAGIKAESYQQSIQLCEVFRSFADEQHLRDFEFVIVFTNYFKSAYKKIQDLGNIKIELETGLVPLNDIISVQAKELSNTRQSDLFYIYTTSENIGTRHDLGRQFIDCLRRRYSDTFV